MHLGNQLRKYVEKNYATKSDFARAIDCSPQLLHSYMRRENIKYSTIVRIARSMGMEAAELMALLVACE
jgi:plasmid maintenance system antidote protein VapI